ncbi:BON domain-containing protein [Dactylosporangium sp. NPDC048998]|uniref:BON domain-containing protein n=1 Tax=Dactylosporangium sp. NPDC048998 TaxID=3363976 RepID=UPI0037196F00
MGGGDRGDEDVERGVLDALRGDPGLWPNDIAVAVRRGVLTLAGWVDRDHKRRAAVAAGHRVPGVRAVVDDVEVRLPEVLPRSDAEIAAAALRALEPAGAGPRVEVTVTAGWVTLGGDPATVPRRLREATLLSRLAGVQGVTDVR